MKRAAATSVFQCDICHDYGWRWTSKIKAHEDRQAAGQWSGWYRRADDPERPKSYDEKRPCICGQVMKHTDAL